MSGEELLIAVVGLGPRTGVTTTALALAQGWPGPEPALLVEADPAGGQLAEAAGADPYRGLASLSLAAEYGAGAVQLTEHLQFLPGGVAFLAAPPGPDTARAAAATVLLTGHDRGQHTERVPAWRDIGATVIADCGAPEPNWVITEILQAADACLVVVHTDIADPARARARIGELTDRARRRGVLLISSRSRTVTDSDFATALALPVLASLPYEHHSATALVSGTRPPHRRNRLLPAARAVAVTLGTQLRPLPPAASTGVDDQRVPRPAPSRPRLRLPGHRPSVQPTVYRLDLPPTARPAPGPAHAEPDAPRPQRHAERADSDTAEGNRHDTEPASIPTPPEPPSPPHPPPGPDTAPSGLLDRGTGPGLVIQIFGPTRILWRGGQTPGAEDAGTEEVGIEITGRVQPRSRELLAVLALHPDGLSRPALLEALWGDRPPYRPGHALANLISRLRTSMVTATGPELAGLLTEDRLRYRLDPALVTVDYWEFTAAVADRRRAGSEQDQAAACERIRSLATTTLATDLSHPWAEPLREAARRNALNAVGWLAVRTVSQDPRSTLGMLETAVETDPYNERLWQDILRLHARLGEYDALDRTYSLLSRKLAEINEKPSSETRQLLDHLRRTTR